MLRHDCLLRSRSRQVATPYFGDATSEVFIKRVTFHIFCDTEGAMIRYTTDGTSPAGDAKTIAPGKPLPVQKLGTVTLTAVAFKKGMQDSDEISKTVTVWVRCTSWREHCHQYACLAKASATFY